ncbi:MAG: tetratricopeptide repeat protein [Magnetococcales bacterium]|nr:tetratricopeptide repeat protein [Magnetococcales bacterium]
MSRRTTTTQQEAFALYATGQTALSLATAQQTLAKFGPDIHLLNLSAICHIQLGNPEQAIPCWQQALRIEPNFVEAHYNLGNLLRDMQRPEEAEAAYHQALRLKPDYAAAHNNLGTLLQHQHRFTEAETALRQALHHKPDFAEAHVNLGNLLKERHRPDEAETALRQALRIRPDYAEAHNHLGLLLYETKRFTEAETALRQALHSKPNLAATHNNLGNLLKEQKRFAEAETALRQALHIHPDRAEIRSNLGVLLQEMQRFAEAEACYRHALHDRPDHAESHNNLGNLLLELKRFAEAETAYRQALHNKPNHAAAHYNLGNLLQKLRRFAEAETAYRQALSIRPDYAEALYNLGILLKDLQRFPEAEAAYRQALSLKPDDAETHNNLGVLLQEMRRFAEADAAYRQALGLKPDYAEAHYNLGNILQVMGRFDAAEAAYQQALHLNPDYVDAQWNLSLFYLSQGRLPEGWKLHEARHRRLDEKERWTTPADIPFPNWNGESLAGKSLLIVAEQGFGDQIQFCRYAALLKARGVTRLTLTCAAPLATLFASLAEVDHLLVEKQTGDYPHHDFWAFYLSLPRHLATTLMTIPASIPYLSAAPERVTHWRDLLPRQGLRVGLVWRGNPAHKHDATRSLPGLSLLAPLWSVPGISFVSLQKGHGEDEANHPPPGQPLWHPGAAITDFADTAALVTQLDLVITIDSAVAHLTGALGKPCWLLLPFLNTDWRWLRDRSDSPWYPGVMRLFRQTRPDGWPDVIHQVTQELLHLTQKNLNLPRR